MKALGLIFALLQLTFAQDVLWLVRPDCSNRLVSLPNGIAQGLVELYGIPENQGPQLPDCYKLIGEAKPSESANLICDCNCNTCFGSFIPCDNCNLTDLTNYGYPPLGLEDSTEYPPESPIQNCECHSVIPTTSSQSSATPASETSVLPTNSEVTAQDSNSDNPANPASTSECHECNSVDSTLTLEDPSSDSGPDTQNSVYPTSTTSSPSETTTNTPAPSVCPPPPPPPPFFYSWYENKKSYL